MKNVKNYGRQVKLTVMDIDESSNQTKTETGCETDENRENPLNITSKLTENDENLDNVISKSMS